MKNTIIVCKTVIFYVSKNGSPDMLLIKRSSKDMNRPGEWDIPGGSKEKEEDVTQALIREVGEETGIIIKSSDCQLIYSQTDSQDSENVIRLLFAVKLLSLPKITLSHEHTEYVWLPTKQLSEYFNHRVYTDPIRSYFV